MKPVRIYTPFAARVRELRVETRDVKTLRLVWEDEKVAETFTFKPGQFVELSVAGEGEATFCLASSPKEKSYVECSVKRVGLVTEAIHRLDPDALVGLRGPYGNGFPLQRMEGRDLVFVAGGIGLAALRSLIKVVLGERRRFGSIMILYGARSVEDLVYREELEQWSCLEGLKTVLTVDPGGEGPDWKGEVGFVPAVLQRLDPGRGNSTVITCGPPVMIRYVLAVLDKMGFDPREVITSLEMKMKCGLGHCGRCNVGPLYACKDGPVFTYAQIREFAEQII